MEYKKYKNKQIMKIVIIFNILHGTTAILLTANSYLPNKCGK